MRLAIASISLPTPRSALRLRRQDTPSTTRSTAVTDPKPLKVPNRLDTVLEAVDEALQGHETTKADALRQMAGNMWCVTALARRGIKVPDADSTS